LRIGTSPPTLLRSETDADIFSRSGDILFLFIVTAIGITTVTVPVDSYDRKLCAEFGYSYCFGVGIECFYYEFYTVDMDASDSFDTVGLDVDEKYTCIHLDRRFCVVIGDTSDWTDMSLGRQ
jgi:hypothetical protein